jgi:bifunctional non-homologous end joining protein LigD
VTLPNIEPMELVQRATPFDHPDWIFEIKHDGFRSLAYIEDGECKLVSWNDFDYRRFAVLMGIIPSDIKAKSAVLDGELVVLDDEGKARFYDLMANRGAVLFAAFDLLWLDGMDLRELPLLKRKDTLSKQIHKTARRTFYVDHIRRCGKALYAEICDRDMEGIVCKPAISPYHKVRGKTTWVQVKNPKYSQAERRRELFNKRRG